MVHIPDMTRTSPNVSDVPRTDIELSSNPRIFVELDADQDGLASDRYLPGYSEGREPKVRADFSRLSFLRGSALTDE